MEYTGPRMTKDEGNDRYKGRDETYLFGLGDGKVVIDGNGIASFINHSCDPNCEPDDVGDRMYIFALRDIQAGEELTYEYNLYDGDDDDLAPCYCGAKNCRGTMYSEEEVDRQKTGLPGSKDKNQAAESQGNPGDSRPKGAAPEGKNGNSRGARTKREKAAS